VGRASLLAARDRHAACLLTDARPRERGRRVAKKADAAEEQDVEWPRVGTLI
jgi:hypothetical protein